MRRVKSEGSWGVVFNEQTEIHHTSEITPYIELRLWEDKDIPILGPHGRRGARTCNRRCRLLTVCM